MRAATLGELLDSRPLDRQMWPEGAAEGWWVSFRTGSGRRSTGSVFVPPPGPDAAPHPVLSYVHGSTGHVAGAAPSAIGLSTPELLHLSHFLRAGYAVAVADYEHDPAGQPHPFFFNSVVATDVVDVVRAARRVSPQRLSRSWLLHGFSKGGVVALLGATIATRHADELRFAGTSALVPMVSPTGVVDAGTEQADVRIAPAALTILAAVTASHPCLNIARLLTPLGRDLLTRAGNSHIRDMIPATDGVTNALAGTTGIARHPEIQPVLDAQHAPVHRFDRPVLLVTSRNDRLARPELTWAYAERLQQAGGDVRVSGEHRKPHAAMLVHGIEELLAFAGQLSRTGASSQVHA